MKNEPEAFKDVEYETLTDEDANITPSARRRWRWNLASFGVGCVLAALITSILFLTAKSLHHPKTAEEIEAQESEWNYCGHSSREAMELGCVMDPPLNSWMPPQCYFHELTSSLPPIFENRQYFSDVNMTQEITVEQLYNGEFSSVYTMRYHDEHCLFQWRKLQYALEKKMKYIDTKTANYKHSKHCADALQEGREPQTGLGQEVVLGFYRCHRTTW